MIVTVFFKWFFVEQPKQILLAGHNFLLWGWQFFSIGYFVPRIFDPWHRDISSYGRGFDLGRFLHVMGWNLISRVIGAFLRASIMLIGLAVELFLLLVFVLVFFFWFILPVFSLFLIGLGLVMVFT